MLLKPELVECLQIQVSKLDRQKISKTYHSEHFQSNAGGLDQKYFPYETRVPDRIGFKGRVIEGTYVNKRLFECV